VTGPSRGLNSRRAYWGSLTTAGVAERQHHSAVWSCLAGMRRFSTSMYRPRPLRNKRFESSSAQEYQTTLAPQFRFDCNAAFQWNT